LFFTVGGTSLSAAKGVETSANHALRCAQGRATHQERCSSPAGSRRRSMSAVHR